MKIKIQVWAEAEDELDCIPELVTYSFISPTIETATDNLGVVERMLAKKIIQA